MITGNKKLKIAYTVFSALCVIAVAAAVVTDLVTVRRITWSAYVMAAVPFAWLILSPLLLLEKHRLLGSMSVFTLTVFPFLFVVEKISPYRDWFFVLAVPVGVAVVLAVWICFVLVKFLKIRKWYLASVCVFIWAVAVNFTIQYFVHKFVGDGFLSFDLIINFISNMGCVILLAVVGYYSGKLGTGKEKAQEALKASEEIPEPAKAEPEGIPMPDITTTEEIITEASEDKTKE